MHTDLFPEPGYSIDAIRVIPQGRAIYQPEETAPVVVRHLVGYESFIELCRSFGEQPAEIAASITSFGDFVRRHREDVRTEEISLAAARFLGNVLVKYRDDAYWIRYGTGFPSAGNRRREYEILAVLELLLDANERDYRTFTWMVEEWAAS